MVGWGYFLSHLWLPAHIFSYETFLFSKCSQFEQHTTTAYQSNPSFPPSALPACNSLSSCPTQSSMNSPLLTTTLPRLRPTLSLSISFCHLLSHRTTFILLLPTSTHPSPTIPNLLRRLPAWLFTAATLSFFLSLLQSSSFLCTLFLGRYVGTNATRSGPWTQIWSHSNI